MVCWRSISTAVSRTGICSQRLSIRLPIGVTVQSSTEASVLSVPPARFWVISRLRRVAASIMMLSCWRSMVMERICGSEVRWVSLTYCSRQPAAHRPRGAFSTPKPTRSRVPNCRLSCWRAVSISNSHSGRRRRPRRPSISDDSAKSSAYSSSAGLVRCSSAAMVSRSAGSLKRKRPELMSSVA